MGSYNGHRNRAYWNVSLWVNNDEGLYRLAQKLRRELGSNAEAARAMIVMLPAETPDGTKYTVDNLRLAIRDATTE